MKLLTLALLAGAGSPFQQADVQRPRLLHDAAQRGDLEHARVLLGLVPNPYRLLDVADGQGKFPLHIAACAGGNEFVQLLLGAEAPVDLTDAKGDTPLICAARNGHSDVVQQLLTHGANTELANQDGYTALAAAACAGKGAVRNQLMMHDAYSAVGIWCGDHVVITDQRSEGTYQATTGYGSVVWRGQPPVIKRLLDDPRPTSVHAAYGKQALAYALQKGSDTHTVLHITRSADSVRARLFEQPFFEPIFLDQCMEHGHRGLAYGLLNVTTRAEQDAIFRYALVNRRKELLLHACDRLEFLPMRSGLRLWKEMMASLVGLSDDEMNAQLDMLYRQQCEAPWIVSFIVLAGTCGGLSIIASLKGTIVLSLCLAEKLFERAVDRGWAPIVRVLLAGGMSADGQWCKGKPCEQLPLIRALRDRHTQTACVLLKGGATADECLAGKNVALMCALSYGHVELVPALAAQVSKKRLFEHLYEGDQQWVKPLMRAGAILRFRGRRRRQLSAQVLELLSAVCRRALSAPDYYCLPSGEFRALHAAHAYPAEIIQEIARCGGLPELVYQPTSQRERNNRRIIEEFYPPAVVAACRAYIRKRERVVDEESPVQIGIDIAQLVNGF